MECDRRGLVATLLVEGEKQIRVESIGRLVFYD